MQTITGVHPENRNRHINKPCGLNLSFFYIKVDGTYKLPLLIFVDLAHK
jgi:hypothetical protein